MSVIEILSLLFGAGALALAAYSRYKQSESESRQRELVQKQEHLEERIERKEELSELADNLSNVSDWLSTLEGDLSLLSSIKNERYQNDCLWWDRTLKLCKDTLAYEHAFGRYPDFLVEVVHFEEGGQKVPVENPQEAAKSMRSNESPAIVLTIDDKEEYLPEEQDFAFLSRSLEGAGYYWHRKDQISDDEWAMFEEFSPNTVDQVEELLNRISVSVFSEAIESSPSLSVTADDFDSIEEMAAYVCTETIAYEGLENDLEELRELIEEIETVEKEIRLTSLS